MKRKTLFLTVSAVLLMSLFSGIALADTPYGSLDEYGGLHILSGAVSPTDFSITLTGKEELYDSPTENTKTGVSLAPQTVHSIAVKDNFYEIKTWLGEKWISPKHRTIYNLEPSQTVLTLPTLTPIYNIPMGSIEPVAALSPQNITAFEKAAGGWYHVKTWLGDKWVNPKIALPQDVEKINTNLELVGGAYVFQYPYEASKILGLIGMSDPIQTVIALEKSNGWYHIHSSFGDGWILDDETSHPRTMSTTLPHKIDKVINLNKETYLFSRPIGKWLAKLAPQQVRAFEVWDDSWYKIHTWIGDAWIFVNNDLQQNP